MNFLLKRIKTHDKGYDFGQKNVSIWIISVLVQTSSVPSKYFLFVVNIKTTINDKENLDSRLYSLFASVFQNIYKNSLYPLLVE